MHAEIWLFLRQYPRHLPAHTCGPHIPRHAFIPCTRPSRRLPRPPVLWRLCHRASKFLCLSFLDRVYRTQSQLGSYNSPSENKNLTNIESTLPSPPSTKYSFVTLPPRLFPPFALFAPAPPRSPQKPFPNSSLPSMPQSWKPTQ